MKIEELDGVIHVEQPFLSTKVTVWAKLPVPHTAPDYNEKVDAFGRNVARCLPEGYDGATIHFQSE